MKKDEEMLNWVSQYLKSLRKAKGWTLEECEQHGWHDWKYLQKIENGQNITLLTFFKLCELYGVDLRLALEKTSSKRREEKRREEKRREEKRREEKRREEKRREEKRREEKRREETLNGIFSENFVSINSCFGKIPLFFGKLAISNLNFPKFPKNAKKNPSLLRSDKNLCFKKVSPKILQVCLMEGISNDQLLINQLPADKDIF